MCATFARGLVLFDLDGQTIHAEASAFMHEDAPGPLPGALLYFLALSVKVKGVGFRFKVSYPIPGRE